MRPRSANPSLPEFDPAAGEIPAHLEIYAPPPNPFPWRRVLISSVLAGAVAAIIDPWDRRRDLVQWLIV